MVIGAPNGWLAGTFWSLLCLAGVCSVILFFLAVKDEDDE